MPWTADTIPPELTAILDARAGKEHSATGAVRSCLAEILEEYDRLRAGQSAPRVVHVVRTEGPTSEVFAGPFHDEDRLEAWLAENRTPAWTHVQVAPIERPLLLADIPERERLVHEDPALAARILEGIAEAERGETVDRGSFAKYLEDDDALPLHWHYGPTAADPNPGSMWCDACEAEVLSIDGGHICTGCSAQDDGDALAPKPPIVVEFPAHWTGGQIEGFKQAWREQGGGPVEYRLAGGGDA